MFCPRCGNQLPDDARFCGECGNSMRSHTEEEKPSGPVLIRMGSAAVSKAQGSTVARGNTAALHSRDQADKRKFLFAGVVAILVVMLAVVFVSRACSSSYMEREDSVVKSNEVVEVVNQTFDAPANTETPDTWFMVSSSRGTGYELMNLKGDTMEVNRPGLENVGSFAEGCAVVSWNEDARDEEWGNVLDDRIHVGFFDSRGDMTVEVTDAIYEACPDISNDYGITQVNINFNTRFSDGRIVIPFVYYRYDSVQNAGERVYRLLVFDKTGNLVFSFNVKGDWYGNDYWRYEDGVLNPNREVCSGGDKLLYKLFSLDGDVLVSSAEPLTSFGYGYYSTGSQSADVDTIYSYDGDVVFDIASLNLGGSDFDDARVPSSGSVGNCLVTVMAYKLNPYTSGENGNRLVRGIFNIKQQSWLVPLDEGLVDGTRILDFVWIGSCHNDVLSLTTSSGYSIPWEQEELYTAMIDSSGSIVFDSSIADVLWRIADSFDAIYLHDGFWLIDSSEGSGGYAVIQFEDGRYIGGRDIDASMASSLRTYYK